MATAGPDLLAVVECSPRAAAAHDRAGWLGLFTADAGIEDPVGSRPHVGAAQIARFYDTFIGPRDITFHRDLDIVSGSTVVRDLDLEVAMGSAVTMHIPAFLRYDLQPVDGEWRLARLRAYWELPAMVAQFLGNGLAAVPAAIQLCRGLLGNQGPAGTIGFATGFRRPGARAKRRVAALVSALAEGDTTSVAMLLSPGAAATIGDDHPVTLTELTERLSGAEWTKMIAAGRTVAVSVRSPAGRGVLFAASAGRTGLIREIRYFPR